MTEPTEAATYDVCGISIFDMTLLEAASVIEKASRDRRPLAVHLCNSFTLSLTTNNAYAAVLQDVSALNLPDGVPVSIFGSRTRRCGPVRGADLFRTTIGLGIERGARHFFFGGEKGVAERMIANLQSKYPTLMVAGSIAPWVDAVNPRIREDDLATLKLAMPDIIWVGLGTPKQDYVAQQLASALSIPAVAVGAAFDFVAGARREAPHFLRGTGLEWIFRLTQEPTRLVKRYAISIPKFIALVVRTSTRRLILKDNK